MAREMTVSRGQPYKKNRRSERSESPTHTVGHHPGFDGVLAKRVVVAALSDYLKRDDLTMAEHDTGLAIQLQLIKELRNG